MTVLSLLLRVKNVHRTRFTFFHPHTNPDHHTGLGPCPGQRTHEAGPAGDRYRMPAKRRPPPVRRARERLGRESCYMYAATGMSNDLGQVCVRLYLQLLMVRR